MPVPPGKAALAAVALALTAALGACSSAKPNSFQDDQLLSNAPSQFSRSFNYASTDACEASRRALLSQGYMTTMSRNDTVDATKNFQPTMDQHIVVEVHVVCTPGDASNTSMVYVNAVQNGYALKKSDTSASVGLSILGSVSLPIRSNSDEMVKISSETIQSGPFYSRFFDLVGRYLSTAARSEPVPGSGAIKITPLPPPAEPVTATASAAPAAITVGSAAPAAAAAAAATGAAVLHNAALPATPVVTAHPAASAAAPAPVTATPAPAPATSAAAPADHATAAAAAIMGVPVTPASAQPAASATSVSTHNAAAPTAASAPVATPASATTAAQTLASAAAGNHAETTATASPSGTAGASAAPATGTTATTP